MKAKFPLILIVFFCFLLGNCGDVFEEDLTDQQVMLLAPADNVFSEVQGQTFWWKELDDIFEGYKIRIVTPSFDSIVRLVEEAEIIDGNTYQTNLPQGVYQWTVVAFNSSSETMPNIRMLTIGSDTSMNLSGQIVILSSPANNMATNQTEVDLTWQKINDADSYRIQIASPDFSNNSFFIADELTNDDFYTVSGLAEGSYMWRVRGENDISVTTYSSRSFTIDQTPPLAPTLTSPANGDTVIVPVTLRWEVDSGSTMDTLFVYKDSLISPPVLVLPTTATSHIFNQSGSFQFFWRVRSVDQAGNVSPYSSLRNFKVQ